MGKGHIKNPKQLKCATCGTDFLGKHYLSKYCCKYCKVTNKDAKQRLVGVNKSGTLLRLYGITIDTYESLVQQQAGKCAICNEIPTKLYVDHCHDSGVVRGLLCMKCNAALGLFKDKQSNLRSALDYLDAAELKKVRG